MDFKHMGNIFPYAYATWYSTGAMAETHCCWWHMGDVTNQEWIGIASANIVVDCVAQLVERRSLNGELFLSHA